MIAHRVSATLLDAYRHWKDDAPWMNDDALAARIMRVPEPPSPAMMLGTAFHSVSENLQSLPIINGTYRAIVDDAEFVFDADSTKRALRWSLPEGVHECKDTLSLMVDGLPVSLVGQADYLHGVTAHELKTREGKAFDVASYMDSYQWRTYCMVFNAKRVVYHLVRLECMEQCYCAVGTDTMALYPYIGLENDVLVAVRGLLDFCSARGLLGALQVQRDGEW